VVVADSTKKVRKVTFTDGGKRIGVDRSGGGVYSVTWKTGTLAKRTHKLLATVTDAAGRTAAAGRVLKVCK